MAQREDIKKIIVRVPNWIGDAVMCLPALESLKALCPQADITVLAKPRTAPVFENNPSVTEIFLYDAGGEHKGVWGKLRLAIEIKQKGFDLAVLFQNAFEAALIAFLAGIPRRVGYARDLRTWFLTRPVSFTEEVKKAHHVVYYLNIVKDIGGGFPARRTPYISLMERELDRAREFLKEKEVFDGESLIGCAPGASFGPAKRWPPERFTRALEALSEDLSATVLIFGGEGDLGEASLVADGLSESGVRHLNLAGEVGLRQFMAIASFLKLFITNDSGPMHIAAALGVPTVAVFGSTDPTLTGPAGSHVRVIKEYLECSPCFERTCPYGHYECFKAVEPGDVAGVAKSLLGEVV
jgi:heptosyltransferase-2